MAWLLIWGGGRGEKRRVDPGMAVRRAYFVASAVVGILWRWIRLD